MKSKRQEKILELIAQYAIETQEELLERLSECGIPSTQATVSRDIKQLDDLPAMIGCVCGDDTVLVVMRDEASAQSFCEELSGLCK